MKPSEFLRQLVLSNVPPATPFQLGELVVVKEVFRTDSTASLYVVCDVDAPNNPNTYERLPFGPQHNVDKTIGVMTFSRRGVDVNSSRCSRIDPGWLRRATESEVAEYDAALRESITKELQSNRRMHDERVTPMYRFFDDGPAAVPETRIQLGLGTPPKMNEVQFPVRDEDSHMRRTRRVVSGLGITPYGVPSQSEVMEDPQMRRPIHFVSGVDIATRDIPIRSQGESEVRAPDGNQISDDQMAFMQADEKFQKSLDTMKFRKRAWRAAKQVRRGSPLENHIPSVVTLPDDQHVLAMLVIARNTQTGACMDTLLKSGSQSAVTFAPNSGWDDVVVVSYCVHGEMAAEWFLANV